MICTSLRSDTSISQAEWAWAPSTWVCQEGKDWVGDEFHLYTDFLVVSELYQISCE